MLCTTGKKPEAPEQLSWECDPLIASTEVLEVGWHRTIGEEWVGLLSQKQAGKQEDWDHTYEWFWFGFSIPVAENSKWVIDPMSWF